LSRLCPARTPIPIPAFARDLLERHERLIWWLHSAWALLFGVGVMWLGSRNFGYLRLAVFHVAFIWVASLFVHRLVEHPGPASVWRRRTLVALNYVNRNFYQQILFFLLPIYYISVTFWSSNAIFLIVVATLAVLSTLDLVYDEHVATRRLMSGVFFALNLFVTIYVMLPILWAFDHVTALRASAVLALLAFATIYHRWRGRPIRESVAPIVVVAVLLTGLVERGRTFVPPVPLRLAGSAFGTGVDVDGVEITGVLDAPPAMGGQVFVLTRVTAPLGLQETVRHRWFRDGELFYESPYYTVRGGREDGYRLWTFATAGAGTRRVRVDVETAGGQLIGRAVLP
jgi:hypothetical protein